MTRLAAHTVVTLALLGACVQDTPSSATLPNCGAAPCAIGSTCVANVCISDTPSGDLIYAAEAYAPSSRLDILTRVEIPNLDVDGPVGHVDVMFTAPLHYSGRVLLHAGDTLSAAARVVFHRASRIAGAPDYEVSANAAPGALPGVAAFTVLLPPNLPGETYDISIYPDDGTLATVPSGMSPPSSLAPPVTLTGQSITTQPATPVDLVCDSAGLRAATGTVVDALSHPLPGMVVRAYIPDPSAPTKRILVSSTGTTEGNGAFQIFIPVVNTSSFNIEVTPGAGIVAPTLTRTHPVVTNASNHDATTALKIATLTFPFYPSPEDFQLPVSYKDSAGGQAPGTGARILFSTTIAAKLAADDVQYDVEAVVDGTGIAHAMLLPGDQANRTYSVTVLPPQTAKNQSLWDRQVAVGATAGVLEALLLPARVQVSGHVLDASGKPAVNVTVRPRVSSDFFTAKELDRLASLNLNEAATVAPDGLFTMYLDAFLLDRSALYDFDVVPAGGSALPQWQFDSVGVGNSTAVILDSFQLPAGALASGKVTDQAQAVVPTAEVHIYAKRAVDSIWKLRTVTKADDSGNIVLVLPSTP